MAMNLGGLENELRELGKIISDKMGIDFAERKLADLRRGVEKAAKEFGYGDWVSCLRWLLSTPMTRDTVKVLASYLTIGETYFFRDEKIFKAIEQRILPEIIQGALKTNKVLRIWSAGCSTGEEPYSLAIMVRTLLPDLPKWKITILGTDINPVSLLRAENGVYTEWSFRGAPACWKADYFVKEKDGRYRLANDIKRLVTFSYHNLVEDPFPSLVNNTNAMNIILCRNVLMYFNPEVRRRVVHHLHASLVDRGWLIASPAETALLDHGLFKKVSVFGTVVHQKVFGPSVQTDHSLLPALAVLAESSTDVSSSTGHGGAPRKCGVNVSKKASDSLKPLSPLPADLRIPDNLSFEEVHCLYTQGRYEELATRASSVQSRSVAKHIKDSRVLALFARAFANAGKLDEAQRWCLEAIRKDKVDPSLHFLLATIRQELGENEEAIRSLRKAVYLDQNFIPAHFALGNLARRHNRLETSEKHFRNVLQLLEKYEDDAPIPESEGLTAARMREIVRSISDER